MERSIEFFPPKTAKAEAAFWPVVKELAKYKPDFFSVTYGAGGSTKDNSLRIAARIQQEFNIPVAMHLTCVEATQSEINSIAQECWDQGIKRLVALRGDPKTGVGTQYQAYPSGYAYASDLVEGLKSVADFDISVAAYPEKHPQAVTLEDDILALKKKQDSGAHRAITQFFFDNADFYRFRDKAVAAGVTLPIIPGILPISNLKQTRKFVDACGARLPNTLRTLLSDDKTEEQRQLLATHLMLQQCADLVQNNVPGFHFYGMNRVEPVATALQYLKVIGSKDAF